jgi:hypothetical protein
MNMKTYASLLLILFLSLFAGRAAGQCTLEAGSGSADQSVCAGVAIVPIKYSAVGATTVASITLPAGLTSSFTAPVVTIEGTPTATGSYSVTLSDGTINLCTSTGTITVNSPLAVSVSIAVSANPVCDGTSVTFTATPTNGGATPVYQWYKNSAPVGSGGITYTYTPANGDKITVVLTSSEICVSGNPATSNEITMSVTSPLAAGVSIIASGNPVCDGASVTFTATPTNGGTTPAYQWYKGSTPVGSGVTTYTYAPVNGDKITVVMISSLTCVSGNPATSNEITMTVNPLTGTPVFTAGDTAVCNTGTTTYSATAANGTVSYSRSPSSAGTINSSSGVMDWDGSFDGTATITATANGLCGTTTATRSVRVYNGIPTRPSAINGLTSVCRGQTGAIYSATPVGDPSYYEWSATSGVTIVSGQGTSTVTLSFASDASTPQTIYVKSGNTCGLSSNTRNLSVEVRPIPTASISGTTTICQNAASPQITINNLTSRPVIVTYNINGADQTEIPVNGSSHEHLSVITTIPGTFIYTLVSVRYQSEASCSNLISGTATVTVTPTVGTPTAITVSSGSDPACQLTNGTTQTMYATTATNNTGFNWSLSTGSAGSINATTGVMTWANGFSGSVDILVTASGCNGPSSQVTRTVNVTPAVGTPTAITKTGIEPTCQLPDGSTTTTYATSATNNTGFNWSLSNSAAGFIDPSTGVMTWAAGFSGTVDIRVTANGCNGPSSQITRTVIVTPNVSTPTPITVSGGTEPTCQLTNGTTTTTYATSATNSTGFNWSISNTLAGSINPTTGVMTWANGFSGSVNIQVTATGCNGISPQVIRTVNITPAVGTPTPITISGGSDPICQLMSGTTMTIYSTTATNSTGFTWSLSNGAAGSINSTSGLMTWINGFSGTVDIQVTASGCGTSAPVKRTVIIHPLPVVTITGPSNPRITSSGNIYTTEAGMSGYNWSISGGGSGIAAGNQYTVAWNTGGNQTVSVNYIDTYTCTATSPTIYNLNVKPVPAASGAAISGYPSVGNTLTATYTYTDGSSGSNSSVYRWLRNGTDPITGATAMSYVPTMDDVNKTLTFEVTPISSVGPPYSGVIIKSSPTELVEDLTGIPVADEVCIEGIRASGNTIRGEYRYTFSKAEGVSTYRWLRRDTATGTDVVVGTNQQYILVAEDIDDTKEIIFEVTPVSSNLTPIPGNPEQSNPLARILIPKTEYSVSEPDVILTANETGGVFSGTGVTGNIFSPSNAGSAGSPYTLTYLLNIVNTSSSCSQQASKIVRVNPNVTSFVGFEPYYCHDGGPDVITVSGVPSDATNLDFTLTDSDGIIAESGNSVTIDPGKMRPGVNKDILYFSYKRLGIFYRISKSFVIDSVGTAIRIINLDPAYCMGDPKKYISVEGIYPAGGTAEWAGLILSDTKPGSAYADPSLGVPGQTYPVTYFYKSPTGCYSDTLHSSVTINSLPDATFTLNPTYNIEGGPVTLIPIQTGGTFSGRGVSEETLFPDIAGLGEDEIRYTITDNNKCSANLGLKTIIRQAQGSFTGIPSVICYQDTTYDITITNLPTTGTVSITGFSNSKNTLVYTFGATTAFYDVPEAGEGLDTLVFSYKWDGVDYSISKAVNVDSLGQVVIKNLAPGEIICDHVAPYELFPSIPGGSFTGPVSGGYLDPLKATRSDTVTYKYTNLKTGCSTSAIVPVTVYPSPKVAFAPADVCIENDSDTTLFINSTTSTDAVQTWLWEFTDAGGTSPPSDDGRYLFTTGGLKKIALTAETINGCSVTKDTTFNLGIRPKADFYWKKDCMLLNDSIVLVDTTFSTSPITSRSWKIFGGAEFEWDKKEARYPKDSTGYIRVEYTVKTNYENCFDKIIKDVYIRPTITIQADGYFEDFESGKRGWVKGEAEGNTWSFGTPDRPKIDKALSGTNAWFTAFDLPHDTVESSSIVSPCFDFSLTNRPLIKLALWRRFEKEKDGAALQYKIGDSKKWEYVGTINDGIKWYNSAVIRGEPGGNQLGWTTMGDPDPSWVDAIHTLDELKGQKDVKFRIAYGSDGSFSSNDGIAFDDIWIGERSRNVLLEHFTNNTDNNSRIANNLINTIAGNRKEDVINIQYHTNFPGNDPYYNENPGDAGARILFYGLIKAPYTFVDGGTDPNSFADIFDGPVQIDSNIVTKRSLIPAKFSISLTPEVTGGVLTVSGKITALESDTLDNLTLFIAVTEKKNSDHAGTNGETVFYNVFRKFIPDAGGISLKKIWTKGEEYIITQQTWLIERIKNSSDIEIIAFIQNNLTKELFQAESEVKLNIAVGIEKLFGGSGNDFALYPNPAVNKLTVAFKEPLSKDAIVRIYNIQGVVISEYKAGSGITEFNINDLGLKGGIYLVRVTSGGIDYGFKKFVVTRD